MPAAIPNDAPPATPPPPPPHVPPPPQPRPHADDEEAVLQAFRTAATDSHEFTTAFAHLVARHELPLRRTVRRLLAWSPSIDPQDVVQDVFLAALTHRKRFRADSALHTWLTAIALRRCRSEQRKWWKHWKHRAPRAPDPTIPPPDPSHPDDTAEAVRAAVRQLPHRDREVIVLYYLEQLPAPQIAHLLHLTPQAVDTRLHRARTRLKPLLEHLQ